MKPSCHCPHTLVACTIGDSWGTCSRCHSWRIKDQKHGRYLAEAANFDGHVWHNDFQTADILKWYFEPSGSGYYYLRGKKHYAYLIAGINYNGHLYYQTGSKEGVNAAQWKPNEENAGWFTLTDKAHNKQAVAGNDYDGDVYHQDWSGRLNALWQITCAEPGIPAPSTPFLWPATDCLFHI